MQGNGFNAPGGSTAHKCHILSLVVSSGLTHRERGGGLQDTWGPTLLTLVFSGVEVMGKFDSHICLKPYKNVSFLIRKIRTKPSAVLCYLSMTSVFASRSYKIPRV